MGYKQALKDVADKLFKEVDEKERYILYHDILQDTHIDQEENHLFHIIRENKLKCLLELHNEANGGNYDKD